jgi:ribose transport system permease protein
MPVELLKKSSRIIALLSICGLLALLSPSFLSPANLVNVLRQAALLTIVATAMTLTMLIAGIDLSVGSILALTSCMAAQFLLERSSPELALFGAAAALGGGALLGCINGLAIAYLRLPAFLVTFGMMQIARGIAFIIMKGTVFNGFRAEFGFIGDGSLLGIPMPVLIALVLLAGVGFLLRRTTFGRAVYGIGANLSAARYSGLSIPRTTVLVYTLSGLISALAGLVFIARLDTAEAQIGEAFALQAIGAAAIGGTSFDGGVGSLAGTVVGALILTVIANGMNLLNISALWQTFVTGAVIIIAVVVDRWISDRK